ncbi:MAG TPA: hypothetical protein VI455_00265 [Terriglobia bacterium]
MVPVISASKLFDASMGFSSRHAVLVALADAVPADFKRLVVIMHTRTVRRKQFGVVGCESFCDKACQNPFGGQTLIRQHGVRCRAASMKGD